METVDGQPVLILRGSLGTAQAQSLREAAEQLAKVPGKEVRVDLTQLEHLGGAPLQVLIALRRQLDRQGARLTLLGTGAAVLATIALAGLDGELLRP